MLEPPIKYPLGQPPKNDIQSSWHFGDTAFRLQRLQTTYMLNHSFVFNYLYYVRNFISIRFSAVFRLHI